MITNLIAAIAVSIVTNWTDIHEAVDTWLTPNTPAFFTFNDQPGRFKNGKYLGKDGVVFERTEIKFDYAGEPQTHVIEKELRRIRMRCQEKPPAAPELIWDDPVVWTNIWLNDLVWAAATNDLHIISSIIASTNALE